MDHELLFRLSCFFGTFIVVAFIEQRLPRRRPQHSRGQRWLNNLGLVVINSVALRALFPTAAVGVALLVEQNNWGLLNQYNLPYPLIVLLAVIALDFFIYLQHVLFHAIPLLWRLHMVHHADLDYDLTTGLRFHPIEIVLSMIIKFGVITMIGAPALAVIIFEILLNSSAMFNHSNIRLPKQVDGKLRLIIVTPDFHRVHHSTRKVETNSNYGFCLSIWDRLFGTYRAQPSRGHNDMEIGLEQFRRSDDLKLGKLLLLPFRSQIGHYPINRER